MSVDTSEHTFRDMRLQGRVLWTPCGTRIMSAKTSAILAFLMDHPHQVFTAEQLTCEVFDPYYANPSYTGRYHVKKIKKLIEEELGLPVCIQRYRTGAQGGWIMTDNEELLAEVERLRRCMQE